MYNVYTYIIKRSLVRKLPNYEPFSQPAAAPSCQLHHHVNHHVNDRERVNSVVVGGRRWRVYVSAVARLNPESGRQNVHETVARA